MKNREALSARRFRTWAMAMTFFVATCVTSDAAAECFVGPEMHPLWLVAIGMGLDQLAGLLTLVLFAGLLAIVGVERWGVIGGAIRQSREFQNRVLTALYYNRVEEACSAAMLFPKSPVASVVSASHQCDSHSSAGPMKPSKSAFHRAVIAQTVALRRSLWILAAIGWSSPVVGLATALGPTARHTGDPPLALCLGLAIAVPAIWLSRGLSSAVDRLVLEADRMSLSILEQIEEQQEAAFENRAKVRHHTAP